jgi:hypothetical protein
MNVRENVEQLPGVAPEASFVHKNAGDIAAVKALDPQLWQTWRSNDLATVKRQCAADYASDDGKTAVNLAEAERYLAGTGIHEHKQGETRALRVSRDVVVLSYVVEVSGTESPWTWSPPTKWMVSNRGSATNSTACCN